MSNQVSVSKRSKMDEGSGSGVQRKSMSPKKTCDLSTQKFIDITDTAAFVDKSLFIKAFLEAEDSVIVTLAPRRFGKSTNMDMLKEFLLGNKELFVDNKLKIWEEERTFFNENCQMNPIIHVDFKSVGGKTEDEILGSVKTIIQDAYCDHKYLVKDVGENWTWADVKLKGACITIETFMEYWKSPKTLSRDEVIYGFKHLSQCLFVYHGKPVYALIDEYDAPIMEAIMKTNPGAGILDETINLISAVMSSFLKGNNCLERGLINASVRIAEVLSKDANNIKYYEFLRVPSFVLYYGFTAKEVQDLFEREEFVTLRNDAKIQEWYNGYQVKDTNGDAIYSSYSILEYLQISKRRKKQIFRSYWVCTGSVTNMKAIFIKCGIRELVEELINGEEVQITTVKKMTKEHVQILKSLVHENSNVVDTAEAHLFLQFLADNGYFNVIEDNEESTSTVKVPNAEIKKLLREECYNAYFLVKKYNLQPPKIRNYTNAIYSVLEERNENAFIRLANSVSVLFLGSKMPNSEDELHCILFTLVYNIKLYHTRSELSVKRIKRLGRPPHLDILVVLGHVGMIIELKFEHECSEKAYNQIETQWYFTAFDEHQNVTEKILLGLHMNINRKVSITYTVNESDIQTITSDE